MHHQRATQHQGATLATSSAPQTHTAPDVRDPSRSHPLLWLQQTVGNRAVRHLLEGASVIQRDDDESAADVDGFQTALGFAGDLAEGLGFGGVSAVANAVGSGVGLGGGIAKGDPVDIASSGLGGASVIAKALDANGAESVLGSAGEGLDIGKDIAEGNYGTATFDTLKTGLGIAGEAGGFDLAEAGGMGLTEMAGEYGLGTALAGSGAALLGAGAAGAAIGTGMADIADSSYTKTGFWGKDEDTGQNRSAMDWGSNWGTSVDKMLGNSEPSVLGGIAAGAGGIVGGIAGTAQGAYNWLSDKL